MQVVLVMVEDECGNAAAGEVQHQHGSLSLCLLLPPRRKGRQWQSRDFEVKSEKKKKIFEDQSIWYGRRTETKMMWLLKDNEVASAEVVALVELTSQSASRSPLLPGETEEVNQPLLKKNKVVTTKL